jgi:hypothetical protein
MWVAIRLPDSDEEMIRDLIEWMDDRTGKEAVISIGPAEDYTKIRYMSTMMEIQET